MTGWIVPGYMEIRELGAGSSGRVVLATHQGTGTAVAIKYLAENLRHDDDFLREFRAEARLLAEVGSAQVAALYEYVEAPRFVTHSFPGSFEPHPYHPGRLDVERGIGEATAAVLAARGHRIEWLPELSIGTAGVCAIGADRERGVLYGGADPRRAARAMGW